MINEESNNSYSSSTLNKSEFDKQEKLKAAEIRDFFIL